MSVLVPKKVKTGLVFFMFSIGLSLIANGLYGDTYYVDRNHAMASDSNPGTIDSPWKTIRKGISIAVAGDTIYIRAGIYTEENYFIRSGSAGRPIIISAYNNETVIVDGTGGNSSVFKIAYDYIHLVGLEIRNFFVFGIKIDNGNNNKIINCKVHDRASASPNNAECIMVWEGDYNEIISCEIYNAKWNALDVQNSNYTKIKYNFLHSSSHGLLNIMADTANYTGMMDGNDMIGNLCINDLEGPFYIRYQRNAIIANNVFVVAGPNAINFPVMYISYGTTGGAPRRYDASGLKIYNNTLVGGKWGLMNDAASNVEFKNNIVANILGAYFVNVYPGVSGFISDYNLYDGNEKWNYLGTVFNTFSTYQTGSGLDRNGRNSNAGFIDLDAGDYHLRSDSDARDAGINLHDEGVTDDFQRIERPVGTAYDIGAYEYSEGVVGAPEPPRNLRLK